MESCTIVTTTANSRLAELHERMPVILHEEDYGRWLDPKTTQQHCNRCFSLSV